MMQHILILALALFATSDVQVASARLGTHPNNVDVSSRPAGHSNKVRKAHHSRRNLAHATGKEIAKQLEVVKRPDFWQSMTNDMVGTKPLEVKSKKN